MRYYIVIIEFVYNSSINISTYMSPFEIVTSYKSRAPIDLIPMSATHRPLDFADICICITHSFIAWRDLKENYFEQ